MVEYSKVKVKLTDTQLKRLKTAVKNKTGTTLRMSLRMFNHDNLPHELLLTTRQKTKLRNTFENNMSTDIILSKAQISKIIQSGGFLGALLSETAGPLMKEAVPLAKHILFPLGITTTASAIDAGIQKKINGSETATLITLMKIVQSLEDSNILLRGVTKTIENKTKEIKRRIFKYVIRYFRC